VDTSGDPGIGAERSEALKLAVLLLLEKLAPPERAAYILREAFDYEYSHIAEILQLEETNVRQLVSRARKHISDGRRTSVAPSEQRRLLEAKGINEIMWFLRPSKFAAVFKFSPKSGRNLTPQDL